MTHYSKKVTQADIDAASDWIEINYNQETLDVMSDEDYERLVKTTAEVLQQNYEYYTSEKYLKTR